jgi:methyltransferase-like protein/SAM-dependent methyltransferase
MTTLIERIGSTYDTVPYTSHAFPFSAPEHLRAVAYLFGLDAPAPQIARVLELGCAAGGNLIPFAVRHPDAQVVGIDLSPVQIEAGQRTVEAMGLRNVRLIQGNIGALEAGLLGEGAQFDYILCHGVYSWVPDEVREAILRACGALLAPDGVAHVSYNTYPGWKAKEIVRDAMLLRGGDRATAAEQLAYARGMIEFLHEMAPAESVLGKVMADHIDMIRDGQDSYLAHEYLELCNAPCYFRDFVGAARGHGLEYLGDAVVASMFAKNYGERAAQALLGECGGDQVVLEQLMDFVGNRTFRQTLLVHAERAAGIRYQLDSNRIAGLHVAGHYVATDEAHEHWTYFKGSAVTTGTSSSRRAIELLNAAWPATVPVSALIDGLPEDDAQRVLFFLGELIAGNAVQFRRDVLAAHARAECPQVRASLRALAELAGTTPVQLFNEWHMPVTPGALERFLLPRIDGRSDAGQLAAAVADGIREGVLSLSRDDQPVLDPDDIAASAGTLTLQALEWFARHSMLAPEGADAQESASVAAAHPATAPVKSTKGADAPKAAASAKAAKASATTKAKPPKKPAKP